MADSIFEKAISASPQVEQTFGRSSHELMRDVFEHMARRRFAAEGITDPTQLDVNLRAQHMSENIEHVLQNCSEGTLLKDVALLHPAAGLPARPENHALTTVGYCAMPKAV
jgi:hypothetical protein